LHNLAQALQIKGRPDGGILNLMGMYSEHQRNMEQAERFYREAAACGWDASLFNLALCQWRRKLYPDALQAIDHALSLENQPAYRVLKGLILESMGDKKAGREMLKEALESFNRVTLLDQCELGWLITAAERLGEEDLLREARQELARQTLKPDVAGEGGGHLPERIKKR